MIWAVILAAGESKRMGKPKLLLPFGEKSIIESIIESVLESRVKNVIVILGSERKRIEDKIKGFSVKITYNPDFRKGMLSSVQCGFRTVPEDGQAVLIVLSDQPGIKSEVIDNLVDAYFESSKGIVLPVYQGERGHPVLIDMKYRQEVENLSPDIGLRGIVYSHPEDVIEVKVDTPSILMDIDDEADYSRELKSKD